MELIGEIWHYRRMVPADARHAFGKTVIRKSLNTGSRAEAQRLEKPEDVEFEEKLRMARYTGPDGFPRDPEARLQALVDQVMSKVHNTEDDHDLDRALAELPTVDRPAVSRAIDEMADDWWEGQDSLDRVWREDLKPILQVSWAIDKETGRRWRNELAAVVAQYVARSEVEHTVDWAYEQWKKARNRPEQTVDEARRYLQSFKESAKLPALSLIRRPHVLTWRDELRATNLAPKSINHRIEIVSAILRTGWRDAELQPPDLARLAVPQEPEASGRGAWTRDELLKTLGKLEPHSWAAWVFVLLLTTGTRLGELIAARREWYDPIGCIHVPAKFTKKKKPHVVPIIELVREPLIEHLSRVPIGEYIFGAPRPSNDKLKISHEASKWFSRFLRRKENAIGKVVHELRHTWIEAARYSPIKQEVYEIITGHSARTVSDRYGGAKPDELMAANEEVCKKFLDAEMIQAIQRLVA